MVDFKVEKVHTAIQKGFFLRSGRRSAAGFGATHGVLLLPFSRTRRIVCV
jgi:hypothetical protein